MTLFAVNLAINLRSDVSRARAFSSLDRALRRRVLTGSIRQQLSDLHKEVTLVGEVNFEPGARPDAAARRAFEAKLANVETDIRSLEELATDSLAVQVRVLDHQFHELQGMWKSFYEYLGVEPTWSVAYLVRSDPLSRTLLDGIVPNIEAIVTRAAIMARRDFDVVSARTRMVTLVIFAVSVVLSVVVATRTSRYLVGRLSELGRGAELIGEVNLQHRIPEVPRDELGELAQKFNEMAGRLEVTQGELQRANTELSGFNVILSRRVEEDLAHRRLAAQIQRHLLPSVPPRVPGYDLAGRTIPAQTIGGDYFDFLYMNESKLALCVGDVSGKGLPASLLMANLQAAIRSQVMASASVAESMQRTNALLHQSTDDGKFATVFYGVLDLERHELTFSNAGHNPPLIVRRDRVDRLETGGTMLGAFEQSTFEESVCALEPGDMLVAYSDGITEARNQEENEFGEEGLIGVLSRAKDRKAADVVEAIIEAALAFSGHGQSDDMTLIVLKRSCVA
jgi:serine phosphatase RsbU (regulator of sigma subunit)